VLAVLHDTDFEGDKLVWNTWLGPNVELVMTRGSDRQKRAGRKALREIHTQRVHVNEREQVPSNTNP
jgi:hypothetical protein